MDGEDAVQADEAEDPDGGGGHRSQGYVTALFGNQLAGGRQSGDAAGVAELQIGQVR